MSVPNVAADTNLVAGRYALLAEIASGGMGAVHLGRLVGPLGFARTVAIKRLHPQHVRDADFVAMFLDEARLAARIRHPNVVATLDIVAAQSEFFMVMDYVHGVSMRELLRAASSSQTQLPIAVTASIIVGTLRGLHGAHEARGEGGIPLGIVHRDVSPQNIMVGSDGLSRVADFGIAKAFWRSQKTTDDKIKGKIAYISPEQVNGGPVGPWSDVYSCAIVFWEALAKRRLFATKDSANALARFSQREPVPPPSRYDDRISLGLDRVIERGLRFDVAERFASASEMADAIEAEVPLASSATVASWVNHLVGDLLSARAALIDASPVSHEQLVQTSPDVSRELLRSESDALTRAVPSAGQSETLRWSIPRTLVAALALLALPLLLMRAHTIVTVASSRVPAASSAPAPAANGGAAAPPSHVLVASGASALALALPPATSSFAAVASSGPGVTSAKVVSAAVRKPPRRRPPSAADHCQPPYIEDARGIRHLKPDCLN